MRAHKSHREQGEPDPHPYTNPRGHQPLLKQRLHARQRVELRTGDTLIEVKLAEGESGISRMPLTAYW